MKSGGFRRRDQHEIHDYDDIRQLKTTSAWLPCTLNRHVTYTAASVINRLWMWQLDQQSSLTATLPRERERATGWTGETLEPENQRRLRLRSIYAAARVRHRTPAHAIRSARTNATDAQRRTMRFMSSEIIERPLCLLQMHYIDDILLKRRSPCNSFSKNQCLNISTRYIYRTVNHWNINAYIYWLVWWRIWCSLLFLELMILSTMIHWNKCLRKNYTLYVTYSLFAYTLSVSDGLNNNNNNNNVSTPFYFETFSLPRSPRTIQMPSHSSFWF